MRHRLARFVLSSPAPISIHPSIQRAACQARYQSTGSGSGAPATASPSPRWLSDLKTRIGKCIMFGLNTPQTKEAGAILQELVTDWRGLLAGSEGFLTGKNRTGLFRQEVVWGEMSRGAHRTAWVLIRHDLSIIGANFDCVTGHVNNVMYNRYAESARVNWALDFANIHDPAHRAEWKALVTPSDIGLILRSIRTDYKFPMKWPDRVTVLHKLRDKPNSDTDHFILDVLILSEVHRRPAARCVEDIVVYDYKSARKAPLKPFMVDKFRETFELQEQAKEKYGNKVTELIRRVRELEEGSWDRPDAKEDMGSAASR